MPQVLRKSCNHGGPSRRGHALRDLRLVPDSCNQGNTDPQQPGETQRHRALTEGRPTGE